MRTAERRILRERLEAQLLGRERAASAAAVCERLLAIQGQDQRGLRLAIRARSDGLEAADVDHALSEQRSLVVNWLNRGTLHLVRAEDHAWLHALTSRGLETATARRLDQEGVSAAQSERGVRVIEATLAGDGPQTRVELGALLERAGVPAAGQAAIHVLVLASARGLIVRGPMRGGQHAYALSSDWLGPAPAVNRERALAELARRYLAGHGPASDRDLAYWSGLPLRDARAGLEAIAPQLDQRPDGLVALKGRTTSGARTPPPRLLGNFDPVLHGWASRELVLGEHDARVVTGGIFRSCALVGGHGAALWRLGRERVELEPFAPISRTAERALERDARDVERFLSRVPGP